MLGTAALAQGKRKLPADAIYEIKAQRNSANTALAFSRDGKRLALGYADGVVTLNNAADGKQIAQWKKHKHAVIALRFTRLGRLLSGDADGAIAVVDGKEGEANRRDLFHEEPPNLFDEHRKEKVTAIAFTPNGRLVAMTRGRFEVKIDIRSVQSYKIVQTLTGHEQRVSTLAYSPDGKYIISSSRDQTAAVWMPARKRLPRKSVFKIHFQPIPDQPFFLASGFADKRPIAAATIGAQGGDRVVLWYYKTGKYVEDGLFNIQQGSVLAMSPDGKTFAKAC